MRGPRSVGTLRCSAPSLLLVSGVLSPASAMPCPSSFPPEVVRSLPSSPSLPQSPSLLPETALSLPSSMSRSLPLLATPSILPSPPPILPSPPPILAQSLCPSRPPSCFPSSRPGAASPYAHPQPWVDAEDDHPLRLPSFGVQAAAGCWLPPAPLPPPLPAVFSPRASVAGRWATVCRLLTNRRLHPTRRAAHSQPSLAQAPPSPPSVSIPPPHSSSASAPRLP
ncbi:hypothetical protein PR003_g34126, partial [Phytophthora rubi]